MKNQNVVTATKQEKDEADAAAERLRKQQEHANTVLAPFQFQPGKSGNPNGRPKDIVKQIGQNIAGKKAKRNLSQRDMARAEQLGFDLDEITLLENIMLKLATSQNPQKVALFLERTFGKVPNVNINAQLSENLVRRFKSKLTDSELEDIAAGADVFEILLDKLPDVDGAVSSNDFINATATDTD